ncbi:hypothetical protein EZ428_03930 [Pedobacter frigiditerrae]|uniref:CarboxypepD_reg-like domain-containing protein n=1 Tax=Pedobacter frigiditerrae TaxID=2530452 RepID=A0A4R0N2A0_9SPHI|nr:hypothetical protein [Pedobacter frigiditerrae]TCC93931.1 hypothetical protein EZ428_03930 [Pedobacter frigiditerrae]
MKQLLIIYLLLFSTNLFAQNVNGYAIDSVTRLPIANAQVHSKNATVLTNENGKFGISNASIGDRVSFRIMGYEILELIVKKEMFNSPINIYLATKGIDLREVKIKTNRNYKKDSLDLRKEYANVFNYQSPKFTDAFIKVDPNYKSPHTNINPNSTASILKLNVLQIVGLLGKNKFPVSKLKQTLLKDEEEKYIDHVFSKSKIETSTLLKGDSLQTFTQRYRPTYLAAKKLNDYEVILYIKKSYAEFIRP